MPRLRPTIGYTVSPRLSDPSPSEDQPVAYSTLAGHDLTGYAETLGAYRLPAESDESLRNRLLIRLGAPPSSGAVIPNGVGGTANTVTIGVSNDTIYQDYGYNNVLIDNGVRYVSNSSGTLTQEDLNQARNRAMEQAGQAYRVEMPTYQEMGYYYGDWPTAAVAPLIVDTRTPEELAEEIRATIHNDIVNRYVDSILNGNTIDGIKARITELINICAIQIGAQGSFTAVVERSIEGGVIVGVRIGNNPQLVPIKDWLLSASRGDYAMSG